MLTEEEIMRRRAFLRSALTAAGMSMAPGVLDAAARLDPAEPEGSQRRRADALEETVHTRGLEFPTVPTVDQLPLLVRNYADARQVAGTTVSRPHYRVHGALAYLAALIAANLSTWGNYDGAYLWYGAALDHATYADDQEAAAWVAARSTLIPVQEGDYRQAVHDAAYAVAHSPRGQLGATLGNALAASTAARLGYHDLARMALGHAETAVEYRDEDRFTAYSFPWYRLGRFASETYTQLGDTRRAFAVQERALAGYPPGASTDVTFLRLDRADCMLQDGYPREAARYATRTVLGLAPECAAPILFDRADEVADLIGTAGGSDTDDLRHVLEHQRVVAG